MLAKGAEARGQGTAQATLNMAVTEREGGSHVTVAADMLVTGRVAQMGRGVMQDVARRMMGQMSQNMESLLAGGGQPEADGAVSAGSLLGSVVADRAKRIFGSGE
jgi:carbon monoxide dehydrogenase subunit G